jgi:hypothetical protein
MVASHVALPLDLHREHVRSSFSCWRNLDQITFHDMNHHVWPVKCMFPEMGVPPNHLYTVFQDGFFHYKTASSWDTLQGGAPSLAKLVYNSHNYGLW